MLRASREIVAQGVDDQATDADFFSVVRDERVSLVLLNAGSRGSAVNNAVVSFLGLLFGLVKFDGKDYGSHGPCKLNLLADV